nr:uncharacterized protein LOC129284039 [Lytechinus pictus]
MQKGDSPTPKQMAREGKPVRKLLRQWERLLLVDGILHRRVTLMGHPIKQLLVPEALKERILSALHDEVKHQASEKTTKLAVQRCYWPGMEAEIRAYCEKCQRCLLSKAGKKLHPKMGSLIARKLLEVLAMDFTVLEPSSSKVENVLVLTDEIHTKTTLPSDNRSDKEDELREVVFGSKTPPPVGSTDPTDCIPVGTSKRVGEHQAPPVEPDTRQQVAEEDGSSATEPETTEVTGSDHEVEPVVPVRRSARLQDQE